MEIDGSRHRPERSVFSFGLLGDLGVLWLINRTVFHPRGFALAIEYADGEEQPFGWSIQGDGSEQWSFSGSVDEDRCFAAVEALLQQARVFGAAPTAASDQLAEDQRLADPAPATDGRAPMGPNCDATRALDIALGDHWCSDPAPVTEGEDQ